MPALQLTQLYTSATTGVETTNGYVRVNNYSGDEVNFNLSVNIWLSESTFTAGFAPIASESFTIPTPNVTGIVGVYDFLQVQPQFAGGIII